MNNFYLTIHHSSRDEVIIQKSRFIGCAAPCETEEDALEFIRSVHDRYRDARHWCYAYVIGQNRGIMRYSDDGEPSGTAGMPMMDVIKNSGVVNCCVVVVRYFGGVLLGTGGLVRAYTQGCKLALQASGIIRMELTDVRECRVSYAAWNMIQHALQNTSFSLDRVEYSDTVSFLLCTKAEDTVSAVSMIDNLTEGKARWKEIGIKYTPWPV